MSEAIYSFIKLTRVSTGRRLRALTQVRQNLAEHGAEALDPLIGKAIEHDLQTIDLERAWLRSKDTSDARGEATRLDAVSDKRIAAFETTLRGMAGGFLSDDPRYVAAEKLHARCFPSGLRAVVQVPFAEQYQMVKSMLQDLQGEFAAAVEQLGLAGMVGSMQQANEAFGAELDKIQQGEVDFHALKLARHEGNIGLRRVVLHVLATFDGPQGEQLDSKATYALLAPILRQASEMSTARRRGRAVLDVDPTTGEEVVASGRPLPEDADEGPDADTAGA